MPLIVDSSVALSWCLPNQASTLSWQYLQRAHRESMLVPPVWHLEVANILGLKQRDNYLSPLKVRQATALLSQIPTETSWAVALDAVHLNLERIARYRIAAYDALYVELARTTGLPLVTYDRAMIRAARETGITVLST